MRRTRTAVAGAIVAAVVPVILVVAACSGAAEHSTSGGGSSKLDSGGGTQASGAAAAPAAPDAYGLPKPVDAANGDTTNGSVGGGSKAAIPATLLDSRSLIRTADITVRVKDIAAADQVRVIAASVHGDVASDDRALGGTNPSATLTIEVPPAALPSVLSRVSALGTERSRTMSTRDVTAQVVDVNSRVKSAQDSIDQLRLLFQRATKLGDIIALENELTEREANLESLQAQQRTLSAQTALAEVTVNLTTAGPATAPPKPKHHNGVGGALWRGWHNFAASVAATTRGLALVGPFVALVLLVAAAALAVLRRHRRSLPAPAPDPAN